MCEMKKALVICMSIMAIFMVGCGKNNKDVINNHMNKIVDDINALNTTIESKEDRYDYVERLDNIIVELITKGE